MTKDDENSDDVVGSLFREVDDHFADLEQQYNDARRQLASSDDDRREREVDYVQATSERYELMSEVASLRSDLSRSVEALAERDRLLTELSERIGGFESQLREGEQAKVDARAALQAASEEKREVSRLNALLEARLAERQELTDLAHRLQADKEHVEELLNTSLTRFEQVDQVRLDVTEKLARIEAVRGNETAEYEARASQLTQAKAEVKRLAGETDDLVQARDDAEQRANRAEGLVERRSNEISYLNRRIEALSTDAGKADGMGDEISELTRANTLLNRRVQELESQLRSKVAETEASAAAVAALADRSSERDEFAAKIAELEQALDAQDSGLAMVDDGVTQPPASADDIAELTARVRNLESPESFSAHLRPAASGRVVEDVEIDSEDDDAVDLSSPDEPAVDQTVTEPESEPAEPEPGYIELDQPSPGAILDKPARTSYPQPEPTGAMIDAPPAQPTSLSTAPQFDLFAPVDEVDQSALTPAPNFAGDLAATAGNAPNFSFATEKSRRSFVARRRIVLPAETPPNSEQAIGLFFSQKNAIVVVDARSSCTQTGMRPSELFDRLVALRDRFDVPVEVVVTPVSTPVGGAPQHAAIGVHSVTGADTVADRVRALCLGLPGDQPVVVIAADDHVRRAAIAEEANVIDPSAALELSTF